MVLDAHFFLESAKSGTLVDARSESEFNAGHIPGAISLPILTDEERHQVGISYKHEGPNQAIQKGIKLVGPRLHDLLMSAQNQIHQSPVYVYCWRGGKRSESLAWLLQLAGYETHVLQGGYKAYRHLLTHWCSEGLDLAVIGGYTGAAKTEILHELQNAGEQIIDLEKLAHHRGSAFGNLKNEAQPTSEQMANDLLYELFKLDRSKTIWVEDESRTIGSVYLPEPFFRQMTQAPLYVIKRIKSERINHLVESYGSYAQTELTKAFERIGKRLGGQHLKQAIGSVQSGDLTEAVEIALSYYDKKYAFGLKKNLHRVVEVDGVGSSSKQLALCLPQLHSKK